MGIGFRCALGFLVVNALAFGADAPEPSKYTGPGSCSSPACHGSVQGREETSVLQNEYSTWVVRDKHAHAYINLTNQVGTRMAKIMGLPKPDTAPRCLACRALGRLISPTALVAKIAMDRHPRGSVRIRRATGSTTSRLTWGCTTRVT